MLVCSVLVPGAGVWANPSAISKAGTAIHRNALFMGILRKFSPCGGLKFRLGFDSASDSDVEPTGRFGLRPENLEHPGETTQPYIGENRPSVPNGSHLKERRTRHRSASSSFVKQRSTARKGSPCWFSSRSDRRGFYSSTRSNANYFGWVSFSA